MQEVHVSETVVLSESDHADLIRTISSDPHEESTSSTPSKRKGNRKKSGIWSLFTAIDRDFALCNLCDVTFSYRTSISNLKKHLVNKHSIVPPPATKEAPMSGAERMRKYRLKQKLGAKEGELAHLEMEQERFWETLSLARRLPAPKGSNNKVSREGDTVFGEPKDRIMSPNCDRIQIKKEKNAPPDSQNSRIFFDDCILENSQTTPGRRQTEKAMRDEFDAIGITIAAKLRKMDERQRLYCERIINEALFKGAFEQLCPSSELVVYHVSSSPVTIQEEQEIPQGHMADSSITMNHGQSAVRS